MLPPLMTGASGGHRNGLESEVLRRGPEPAPPHGVLDRNGMAPMAGQEVTETGSLSHTHKKPPHSSHHLWAAGLWLPFHPRAVCTGSLRSAVDRSTTAWLRRARRPEWVRMEQGMLFGEKGVSLLLTQEPAWNLAPSCYLVLYL